MGNRKPRAPRTDDAAGEAGAWRRADVGYFGLTAKPLHVLVFVLPLIILYELGSWRYLTGPHGAIVENIRAHSLMLAFFQDLGVVGRFVPAILMVTVLVVWHIFNRDRLRLKPLYVAGMAAESLLWTVPLLVIVALVHVAIGGPVAPPPVVASDPAGAGSIWALSREARITISIGAGLYEELLFRMIGLVLLHAIFVDLMRVKDALGTTLAVLISALAFAFYHDVTDASGQVLWSKSFALFVAGAYFGLIYVLRGFGIVVGVHALYDVFVLVILRDP